MGFPANRCPAGDAMCWFHHLVDDKRLSLVLPVDRNKPLVAVLCDHRVEAKLLIVHPEKPEDHGHKPQSIFVDVKLSGGNPPQPVELLQPHERPTEGKAQDESTLVLSNEHFPRIPRKSKFRLRLIL